MEPYDRPMHQSDRISMRHIAFRCRRHVIEVERRLEPQVRSRDPSQASVGDHHVRVGASTLLGATTLRDILAPPDRKDVLARFEVGPNDSVAGLQELLEGRHQAEATPLRRPERSPAPSPYPRLGGGVMAFEGLRTIGQIHVSVTDIDRAVTFYRDVLGITFLFQVPGQPMAFFDCDGLRLYLGKPETAEFRSNPVLYFRVDDIDVAHRALTDRGVVFTDAPHAVHRTEDAELWMAAFKDPDGNNLVLMAERPAAEAPHAMAARIADGIDSTSAHGEATTRRVIAL